MDEQNVTPEDHLVPHEGELISSEQSAQFDINEAFEEMQTAFNQTLAAFINQDPRAVDMAERRARAAFAKTQGLKPTADILLLDIWRHLTMVYTPLVRAMVFQQEGKFNRARQEYKKGNETCEAAMVIIGRYEQSPDAELEIIEDIRPIFRVFPTMFKGMDASVRAEIVGFQGNIRQYKELLREAIHEFRKVDQLPSSSNITFMTMVNMMATHADRYETRIEVFDSGEERRYLIPYGNKIFIIHGHDEAKWRELRDLLEDKLELETLVLKEEPGAGTTLIRKFEDHAHECGYAFALVTPDDFVEKDGKSYFQARPNVLFELGWFYGHFGRDRVCIVKKAGTELPSDLAGILSIDFHKDISEGYSKIQDELTKVGILQ